jgi:hypothetical protein
MNHQPFENWLLTDEPLSVEQSQALNEHLRVCETCNRMDTSWNEVQDLFQSVHRLAPAPGFTARWQERRAAQLSRHHQRQSWIFLIGMGTIAAALLAALGLSALSLVIQPEQLLIYSVYRLSTLLINVVTVGDFLSTTVRSLGSSVPFVVWIGLSGLASMLSVIWFVLFRQLITQRRVVQ